MLHKPSYREEWLQKKQFYENNGFTLGRNPFVTTDDEYGAIDLIAIYSEVISKIKPLV